MARYTRRRATRSAPRRISSRRAPVRSRRVAPRRTRRAASGRAQVVRIVVQNGPSVGAGTPLIMSEAGKMLTPANGRSRF